MPTYEYKCDACGYQFERFQSITADPIKRCPECGKAKVKRLIGTGAGLIFKGSGFYITDYRDKSYTDKAKAESGASSSSSSDGKSDSKPAETSSASSGESKPAAAKTDSAPAKSESKPSSPKKGGGGGGTSSAKKK
jgi:putative FmdB family regulatory protein